MHPKEEREMVVERRLFVRFSMSGSVVVQVDPEKNASIDGELVDLSYDGIGLYSMKQLIVYSKVKFLIINRQLNVNLGGIAKVAYCKQIDKDKGSYRIGLEFIEVDREQIKSILIKVRDITHDNRVK
jgi:c-di-GMP-binding flagellar brake protein YcgR